MNKQSAIEWLEKSWHNLSGAKIFYDAQHYTDVTAVELHYSIEKSLKTFLANKNKKIPKTHDLYDIYQLVKDDIDLSGYDNFLDQVTNYHIEESCPAFDRTMPSLKEIKVVLDFAYELFDKVCDNLDIDKNKIKNS